MTAAAAAACVRAWRRDAKQITRAAGGRAQMDVFAQMIRSRNRLMLMGDARAMHTSVLDALRMATFERR